MKEEEIVYTAIENLDPNLNLQGEWHPCEDLNGKTDGIFELLYEGQKVMFDTIVKKELRTYLVNQVIEEAKNRKNLMVIAWKIFPALKERLKEHRINYLEANGNMFVNAQNILLLLDAGKKLDAPTQYGNRAFTPTGLKVVFEFLRDKELINHTQREIAVQAGVALGNIPKVLQGLKDIGQIYKLNKKELAFHDRNELLHIWAREYHNTLKPTLELGRFTIKQYDDWKDIPLNTKKTVWGGEPAADLLTNYLKPGVLTLYTTETKKDLVVKYGLIPDKKGNLFVYQRFWKNREIEQTAPEMLVYADLIHTNDKRCIETANILFNERIKPEL